MSDSFDMSLEALQARVQLAARRLADQATERTAARIQAEERDDGAPPPTDRSPARALLPDAVQLKIHNMDNQDPTVNPLHFLEAPPDRPDGQRFDDLSLLDHGVAAPTRPASPAQQVQANDEAAEQKRSRIEREQAEAALDAKLRAMEVGELYDWKRAAVIPPVLLTAEQITAMVNLMMRILSFGLLKRANTFADIRAAKESLGARAAEELQRRKRSPASVADRLKLLSIETAATKQRERLLGARASSFWAVSPAAAARIFVERARAPNIPAHRAEIQKLGDRTSERSDEIAKIEAEIPVGVAGFLVSRKEAVQLARAKLERLKAQNKADDERRTKFALALEVMIDEFEARFAAEVLAEQARVVAERAATKAEIDQLGLELRVRLPEERHRLNDRGAVERPRESSSFDLSGDDVDQEAERARLRRLLGKGG